MADVTAKHLIPYAEGTDLASTIDDTWQDMSEHLDGIIATDDQGTLASRPVSTPGSPGKEGRYYRTTDAGNVRLYRDNGTGWDEIALMANAEPQTKIISGSVSGAGVLEEGFGFTCGRTSTGLFWVLYADNFSDNARVVVNPRTGGFSAMVVIVSRDANGFSVMIRTDAGVLADYPFDFIAIGPA